MTHLEKELEFLKTSLETVRDREAFSAILSSIEEIEAQIIGESIEEIILLEGFTVEVSSYTDTPLKDKQTSSLPSRFDDFNANEYNSPFTDSGIIYQESQLEQLNEDGDEGETSSYTVESYYDSEKASEDAEKRKAFRDAKRKEQWDSWINVGLTQAQLHTLSGMLIYNPLTYGLASWNIDATKKHLGNLFLTDVKAHKQFIDKLFSLLTKVNNELKEDNIIRVNSDMYPSLSLVDCIAATNYLQAGLDETNTITVNGKSFPLEQRESGKENPFAWINNPEEGKEISYTNKISILENRLIKDIIPFEEEPTMDSDDVENNYESSNPIEMITSEAINDLENYLIESTGSLDILNESKEYIATLDSDTQDCIAELFNFYTFTSQGKEAKDLSGKQEAYLRFKTLEAQELSICTKLTELHSSTEYKSYKDVLGITSQRGSFYKSIRKSIVDNALSQGVKCFVIPGKDSKYLREARGYLISQGCKEVEPNRFRK